MSFLQRAWRPVLFDLVMYPMTIFLAIAGLPLLVSKQATGWLARLFVVITLFLVRHILGIYSDFQPRQPNPNGRGRLLAPKHQSAWETLALRYYYPHAVGVAKQVLFRLPFGWYMRRLGYIPIDREGGAAALRTLMERVNSRLDAGLDVVIYPEGTRREIDAKPAYKSGIYGLYRYCDVDVLPIALDSGKTWGRRPLYRKPGKVQVQELPLIPRGMDKKAFMATLEKSIEAGCVSLGNKQG